MHIATVGDVMLDVVVDVPEGLRADDDTPATIELSGGGQAANVATWAVALGASATLIGPRGTSTVEALIAGRLTAAGVSYAGISTEGPGAVVVSILTAGTRTLATDAGDQSWLSRVTPALLPADVDWLHVSSYPLLRTADASPVVSMVEHARRHASRVSVDLSSSALLETYGAEAFRSLLDRIAPDVVFANLAEWSTLAPSSAERWSDVVVKEGAAGATVLSNGVATTYPAPGVAVTDSTGAGDAFAAGYLVGGVELALRAAARCLTQLGAQPDAGAPAR